MKTFENWWNEAGEVQAAEVWTALATDTYKNVAEIAYDAAAGEVASDIDAILKERDEWKKEAVELRKEVTETNLKYNELKKKYDHIVGEVLSIAKSLEEKNVTRTLSATDMRCHDICCPDNLRCLRYIQRGEKGSHYPWANTFRYTSEGGSCKSLMLK